MEPKTNSEETGPSTQARGPLNRTQEVAGRPPDPQPPSRTFPGVKTPQPSSPEITAAIKAAAPTRTTSSFPWVTDPSGEVGRPPGVAWNGRPPTRARNGRSPRRLKRPEKSGTTVVGLRDAHEDLLKDLHQAPLNASRSAQEVLRDPRNAIHRSANASRFPLLPLKDPHKMNRTDPA